MPRRKYGRLRKPVERPSRNNCSRCRSGKYCPLDGHKGNQVLPERGWKGPNSILKRAKTNHSSK